VEAGVQVAPRWVLAPLRHRRFFSLAELNDAITAEVAKVNARPFRGQPTSRDELFAELQAPALRPLPAGRDELASWKKATVSIDSHLLTAHVAFDHRFSSVPFRLVRQKVDIRATRATGEVYHGGRRVAVHAQEWGRRHDVTEVAHMPASHRAHAEWTPSRLVAWAGSAGPSVSALAAKAHPEYTYRSCLGLDEPGMDEPGMDEPGQT
jgi:hypothetical protein